MRKIDRNDAPAGQGRRMFLGLAALAGVAAPLGQGSAAAETAPGGGLAQAPWGTLCKIDAGDLSIAYADPPSRGAPVILLHGWPYDIHSFAGAAPYLAAAGHRVIIPYLRGYGETLFRSAAAARNGQQAAFAVDVVALMDALQISKAIIAGFDWGARTANIVAVLWPERCRAMVSVSGYLIGSQKANEAPLPPEAELSWRINSISRPSAGIWAMNAIVRPSQISSGGRLPRNGRSTTRPLHAPRKRSPIPTTSPSPSITIVGGWGWHMAKRAMMRSSRHWPRCR